MPYATNALDGRSVYYEDGGGPGAPVVLYGGILDTVELVRASNISQALREFAEEFRLVYADHRGLGKSDKPYDVAAYAMSLQAADVVAVLDAVAVERAHLVGRSYGGRLAFGFGQHAPERVLSLVAGGQQPYAMNSDGPLAQVIAGACEATRRDGSRPFVEALERHWDIRFPEPERGTYLRQDGASLAAAAKALLNQGAISEDLSAWRVACLIYLGAGDVDFVEQARHAAAEIPNATLVMLDDLDHYGAHFEVERVVPAVLRHLRENS